MDATEKEIRAKVDMLHAMMMDILDADPGNGWAWIVEAQRRTILALSVQVAEPEQKAS